MSNELREAIKKQKFFYRDLFRKICSILWVLLIVILVLSLLIVYFYIEQSKSEYYASSGSGVVTPLTPLKAPNYSNTPLIQ